MPSGLDAVASEVDGYESPGWKRLRARTAERPLIQPKIAARMTIDATVVSSHSVGERVFHQKFGYGQVANIEGDKLQINFDKAGVKKVVSNFVCRPDEITF